MVLAITLTLQISFRYEICLYTIIIFIKKIFSWVKFSTEFPSYLFKSSCSSSSLEVQEHAERQGKTRVPFLLKYRKVLNIFFLSCFFTLCDFVSFKNVF